MSTFADPLKRIEEIRRRTGQTNTPLEQQYIAAMQEDLMEQVESQIDQDTGASLMERAQVGAAKSSQDKLATVRNFYPEASPYGDDNFLVVNRENYQPSLFNPPGMDFGDVAEYGREIAATTGGVLGAAVTSPTALSGAGPYFGASGGATLGGYLYDQGMEYLGDTVDTRTPFEQQEDYATEAIINLLPVDLALSAMGKGMLRGKEAIRNVVNKYDMNATAGTVGGPVLKQLEASFSRMSITMDSFNSSADRMYESLAKVITQLRQEGLGTVGVPNGERSLSAVSVAEESLEAAQRYITDFRKTSNTFYDDFHELVPRDTQVIPLNFYETARGMLGADGLSQVVEDSTARKLFEAGSQGTAATSYDVIKQLRTFIGDQIASPRADGLSRKNASDLYDALTLDMMTIAREQGDEAVAALTRANDFYRAGRISIDEAIAPVMQRADGSYLEPTQLAEQFARLAKDRPQRLGKLNERLNVDLEPVLSSGEMQRIGVGMLDDLAQGSRGQATATDLAGEIVEDVPMSPSRILAQTSDETISPIAKDYLFNASQREIIGDLRTFAASVKQTEDLVNRSNSGNMLLSTGGILSSAGLALTGDIPAAGAMFVSTVAVPYLASKGMQSGPFVNWLKRGIKEGVNPNWYETGARIAADQGLLNLYQAIGEETGMQSDSSESVGVLQEQR